jgi:hypothetical protein
MAELDDLTVVRALLGRARFPASEAEIEVFVRMYRNVCTAVAALAIDQVDVEPMAVVSLAALAPPSGD